MNDSGTQVQYNPAEITALSHLYRGEMYRSKIWRTRLDTTTNWAVGSTGVAVSISFSNPTNSPIPLIVMTILVTIFLGIEARRYRYFDIWRTRVRIMEVSIFSSILRGDGIRTRSNWNKILADDYENLQFNISFLEAFGRRLRRNYFWIFLVLALSYIAKITVHPTPITSVAEIWGRAALGPIPGELALLIGTIFNGLIGVMAVVTLGGQKAAGRVQKPDREEEEELRAKFKI